MNRILCKLFGHKRPWLFTPDEMRCVCARCGYATDSLKAVSKFLASAECNLMIRESCKPNPLFQFEELKAYVRIEKLRQILSK